MQYIRRFILFLSTFLKMDANYFIKGGLWLTVTQVVTILGGLTVSILFAHILSTADYGIYRYLISLAGIFTVFSLSGLDQSITQAAARKHYRYYSETILLNFAYSSGIIFTGILGSIYYIYNQNSILALGCLSIALFYPLINTFQNITSFLQGCRKFKESTIVKSIKVISISSASILSVLITQNIFILFLTYLVSTLFVNILTHFYFRTFNGQPTPTDAFVKYVSFAKNSSVRNLIVGLSNQLDSVIIFTQLGATDLAIYSVANLIPKQLSGSLKNLAALLVPKYANYTDIRLIRKTIPRKSFIFFGIVSLGCLLYILLAPYIFKLIFPKYEMAIFLSQLAVLSLPALTAMIPMSALQSQLKERELYFFSLQSSVILIILTIGSILSYGLIGAIVAKILSRYVNLLLAYYHLSRCK